MSETPSVWCRLCGKRCTHDKDHQGYKCTGCGVVHNIFVDSIPKEKKQ